MLENTVLVTGAGCRVGYHLARCLHQDGYTVLAHYRTATADAKALYDDGIATIQADLADSAAIFQFVQAVKNRCNSMRAIIHNASSFAPTSTDLTEAARQYQQFFTIHMLAPFLINQGLRSQLQAGEHTPTDIIHITDINVENPTPAFDIYGTTKAGLHNMMLVLAKKFAPDIKVNAIAPGPVLFNAQHSAKAKQQMLAETPLAQEGGIEPVYLVVQGLLANAFITGASVPVDGGRRLSKR